MPVVGTVYVDEDPLAIWEIARENSVAPAMDAEPLSTVVAKRLPERSRSAIQ